MFELMGMEINAILGAQTILIWTYDNNMSAKGTCDKYQILYASSNICVMRKKADFVACERGQKLEQSYQCLYYSCCATCINLIFKLVCEAEQAGLSLTWSQTTKTGFIIMCMTIHYDISVTSLTNCIVAC